MSEVPVTASLITSLRMLGLFPPRSMPGIRTSSSKDRQNKLTAVRVVLGSSSAH